MLYYVKPHNEYICSISVDSDFDFDSQWTLMGETATHFYMNTDNTDKAYAVAKALGVSITTVNTTWEIDPCLLECDCCYLNTLSWSVEYWDNLPVEMIDAIIATGDEYGFVLYTKAYAYMRNGIAVYNNPDIDWDAPAPELPDDEPVHHDIKLDDVELPVIEPVEVIVVPQEVLVQPQEDLSTTTQINGDDVMNNNTVWLDWSISTPCLKAWELDFGTYVPVVESEPVVEVVKPHYSDKWFGQCCDLNDNPEFTQWDIVRTGKPYFSEVIEFTPLPSKAPSIMNIGRGKVYFPTVLTPEQLDDAKAKIQATVIKAERKASLASPVKQRQVSPHATVPFGNAPEANRITNPKITSAIGEASAIDPVSEFKSTLFNLDNFDVVKQAAQALLDMFSPDEYNTLRDKYGVDVMKKAFNTLQGDVRNSVRCMINKANTIRNGIELTVVATTTPKAPATPKPSTATFASNFNSLVMAKYRELNGGIIKDSLVLNKLTSALRANNSDAYANLVTTFNNPVVVSLHRQAYDAVVSAS